MDATGLFPLQAAFGEADEVPQGDDEQGEHAHKEEQRASGREEMLLHDAILAYGCQVVAYSCCKEADDEQDDANDGGFTFHGGYSLREAVADSILADFIGSAGVNGFGALM